MHTELHFNGCLNGLMTEQKLVYSDTSPVSVFFALLFFSLLFVEFSYKGKINSFMKFRDYSTEFEYAVLFKTDNFQL